MIVSNGLSDLSVVAQWAGISEQQIVAQNCDHNRRRLKPAAQRTMAIIARSLEPMPVPLPGIPLTASAREYVPTIPTLAEAIDCNTRLQPKQKPKRVYKKPLPHQQLVITPRENRLPVDPPANSAGAEALRKRTEARRAIEDRRMAREMGL